jgi:signal transduction histidine kinase
MKKPTYLPLLRWMTISIFLLGLLVYRLTENYLRQNLSTHWATFLAVTFSLIVISALLAIIFKIIYKRIWELTLSQEKQEEMASLLKRSKDELEEKNIVITQKMNELRTLDRISKAISSTMDLDRILSIILQGVCKNLNFDRAIICLVNEKEGFIEGRQAIGVSRELVSNLRIPLEDEQNPIVRTIKEGRPYIIAEVSEGGMRLEEHVSRQVRRLGSAPEETKSEVKLVSPSQGVTTYSGKSNYGEIFTGLEGRVNVLASVPLVAKERVNGVLLVDNLHSGRPIEEEDLRALVTFTNQAGLAIENARLYDTEKRFSEELRHQVELAKKELKEAQAQIIHSERLAAIGEMSVIVAHEVRNPMSSIRSCAQRIHKAVEEGNPNKKYTNYIMQEVDRLERIVKDMLTVTRQPKPNLLEENVNKLINEILIHMDDEIKKNGVLLIKELDQTLPLIPVDPALLEQMILNMVQNALFFMQGREKKELKIATAQDKKYLQIKISDTGPGIPLHNRKKIFEPFFTTKPQGTGLGLAICQRIVVAHNGKIELETEINKGSTFIVSLPMKRVREKEDEKRPEE